MASVAESALSWAIKIANDPSHGYSQASRWGNPDYDCSSFVISAYKAAGVPINTAIVNYTGNMQGLLQYGRDSLREPQHRGRTPEGGHPLVSPVRNVRARRSVCRKQPDRACQGPELRILQAGGSGIRDFGHGIQPIQMAACLSVRRGVRIAAAFPEDGGSCSGGEEIFSVCPAPDHQDRIGQQGCEGLADDHRRGC